MIELNNFTKKYDQRGIAGLHGLNLKIQEKEIFALMGPNGCGKSSLLAAITGDLHPDSGSSTHSGRIHHFKLQELPAGMKVQKYLISRVSPELDEEKKIQLTRDFADIFEFTFQLKQDCKELSQGQRQKVMLAAELINNPDVLLMDEPFAHLDPFTRQDVLTQLFSYVRNKEMTVVWVTHDREEAMRFADRLAVMQHGKFEQVGRCEEFLRPKNLFVAQFMGYKNFLIVKKFDGKWQTPWGQFKDAFEGTEAVLVIPIRAIKIDLNSGVEGIIKNQWPQPGHWEVQLEWEGRSYFCSSDILLNKVLIPVSVDLTQTFLIPL